MCVCVCVCVCVLTFKALRLGCFAMARSPPPLVALLVEDLAFDVPPRLLLFFLFISEDGDLGGLALLLQKIFGVNIGVP